MYPFQQGMPSYNRYNYCQPSNVPPPPSNLQHSPQQYSLPNLNYTQQTPQLMHNSHGQFNRDLQRSNSFASPMADRREQYLWNLFQRMDLDGSGSITVYELQKALINGDWSPFNIETVRMMVSMFDVDNNGTIDFREFRGLWKYVEDWSHCFKRFDYDNSGSIDCYEMKHALKMFGYNVSDGFVKTLVQTFDKHGNGTITFDNFVQACVTLSALTKSFRARDYDNRGSIMISYEDFLTVVISSRPDMKGS
ncbi:Programmed cell death protein 6 [Choanephora cucurbitarum]|uniref:Programmed cell death protein 6 n=1 Tax=Choanephora cucurbitarum TaxID=101091 RepID=A0A1C7N368_9FUNG|nr:Programmed cell death protein 6 [Choanephora cucurbitarum]